MQISRAYICQSYKKRHYQSSLFSSDDQGFAFIGFLHFLFSAFFVFTKKYIKIAFISSFDQRICSCCHSYQISRRKPYKPKFSTFYIPYRWLTHHSYKLTYLCFILLSSLFVNHVKCLYFIRTLFVLCQSGHNYFYVLSTG